MKKNSSEVRKSAAFFETPVSQRRFHTKICTWLNHLVLLLLLCLIGRAIEARIFSYVYLDD